VDIWSIGCILAEMILGRILFTGNNLAKQWQLFVDVLGSPSEFSFLQKLNVKEQNRAVVEAIEPREPVDWEKFIPEEAVPKLVNQFLTSELDKKKLWKMGKELYLI
jgi:serine/threonine protein kinase